VSETQAALPPRPARGEDLDEAAFQSWYGTWRGLTGPEVAELLDDCGFPWWVAGGWSMEAAGAAPRPHGDTDVVVLRRDLSQMREWLAGFHLWEAHEESLRPLFAGREMPDERHQLWMRRDAFSPWLLDLLISPSVDDLWVCRRDESITRPIDDIGWTDGAGVHYLQPEIVLLFKAKHARPKDEQDLSSLLPKLSPKARTWLTASLQKTLPGHAWLERLRIQAEQD
jgi:hypothetical protein